MSALRTVRRAATIRSSTYNPDERTIDVVWSTGAAVTRSDWDGDLVEILSMKPDAVRLDRMNAGAALLDTHDSSELARVIGSVEPGSARIEGGKGLATVRLSAAKDCADAVLKIVEGSVRNVSVGYWIHSQTESETGGVRTITATDWEPLEISAVPVPADAGAGFRSAGARRRLSTGRAGELRRMARAAGMPNLAAEHIERGTTPDAFFNMLVARLGGGSTRSHPVTKPKTFADEVAEGRRMWEGVLGRGSKRDEDDKRLKADDLDDEDDMEAASADDDDDDVEDEASAKEKKDDEDRRRGARSVRNLSASGVRSSAAASLANVKAHRREDDRADERLVSAAVDYETGKRAAERVMRHGFLPGK